MTHTRLILLLSLLCFSTILFSQDAVERGDFRRNVDMPGSVNATVEVTNPFALEEYGERLANMDDTRRRKINLLYDQSFDLENGEGCELDSHSVDIRKYYHLRKPDERVRLPLDECAGSYIVLHSFSDLSRSLPKAK